MSPWGLAVKWPESYTANSHNDWLLFESRPVTQLGWRGQEVLLKWSHKCFLSGFVNWTMRVKRCRNHFWISESVLEDWVINYLKGTNTNNRTGHKKETPIHVGRGHALYGWAVTERKQDSGRATIVYFWQCVIQIRETWVTQASIQEPSLLLKSGPTSCCSALCLNLDVGMWYYVKHWNNSRRL